MASKPEIADPPFKTTSTVWKYFGFPKRDGKLDKTQTICRKCYKLISYNPESGSTSSMRGHIKTHHPDIDLSGLQIGASTSNDMEPMQGEQNAMQLSYKQHHGNATIDEPAFSKVKDIMKHVHDEISRETELNKFLKGKICDLEKSKMELVGVFGRTGAGKSSLINAIIGEKDLLPSGDLSACTSVMIQVQANMKDSKYIAEIEFIPAKEWEDELWDYLKNHDSKKNEEGDTDDDDIKEKISALYGEDAKNFTVVKDYMDPKNFGEIREFRQSQNKILKCNTASELSDKIAKYTRRDGEEETGSNTGRRYWPLVKCVTIKVPNASELLQHVALVDLPGTGDCNKSRDEMWKKFVGDCSAVWIVSDAIRADSDKEAWEMLEQTISLIGNGGECRSISFICTKCDVIDDKHKKSKEETRDYVLQKNKRVKDRVRKKFDKEKGVNEIEKHFSGDSGFFQVFTVSSKEFNRLEYLQEDDTEIPQLRQFVKGLNNHQSKTNYYVSGAYGILSLMKAANTPETGSLKVDLEKDLETRLQDWIDEVNRTMMKCKEAFERCLDEGVQRSLESCESILKGVTKGKTVHPSMLKSLLQNNGIYKKQKNKRKTEVNLNEKLSKHLRGTIDQEFSKTFPNEGRPGPIKEAIDKFTLDTDSLKQEGVALQMTFLKTEEEKLKIKLANVIREEKKKIYSSLTKSIQESMQPCYDKATGYSGKGMLENMRQDMHVHLNTSKSMFVKAKERMLHLVESLKDKLLETLQHMLASIDHSLKINDDSVPDITEQYEEVKKIYDKLNSPSRRSTNTSLKESTDSPSPSYLSMKSESMNPPISCLSMKSDISMSPPINVKTQTYVSMEESTDCPSPSCLSMKSDISMSPPINIKTQTNVSSSEFISSSHVLHTALRCCMCPSIMTDPVSIPCGHSYCKHCINTYWAEPSSTGDYMCPLTPLCKKSYAVRPELSVNVALSWVLHDLQQRDCSTLKQTGSGDVALKKKKKKMQQLDAACDVCSSFKRRRAVKTCLTCCASYCKNHLRKHNTVPALQKHTLAGVNEDTRISEQECSSGRMGLTKEEPSIQSEEHQEIACKRRKLAGEEEGEMFHHSSELRLEQSALNTQVYTQAEPQQEKHDLRKQPDVVKDRLFSEHIKVSSSQYENPSGGAIEMVSPASSPVQPQQDKPGDRRPQAEGMCPFDSISRTSVESGHVTLGKHIPAGGQRREETRFTPSMHIEQTTIEYRFKFPLAGLFQCSLTRLKFKTTGEGEVLFRTVQWAERWLTGRTPAGPLFSIECPQESICQLHLPHCEITPGDDLSVAHITDEGVNFLETMEVTKTHVVVNVTHLSLFGLLKNFFKPDPTPEPSFGQVLLFLRPPSDRLEMKVFLLPSNVTIEEVKVQHKEDTYIDTTSDCVLTPKQVYSLHSTPHEVHPQGSLPYRLKYGPNYHQTFEVSMDLNTADISLEVRGPEDKIVWQRLKLRVKGRSVPKRTNSSLSISGIKTFFTENRGSLVSKVKNVESIVDDLLSAGFSEELATNVQAENTDQARVRRMLDSMTTTVLEDALFNALLQHEPTLMKELLGEKHSRN